MKTIESTMSLLTDLSIVEDLRKVLREKDREFLSVETKFKEATCDFATKIGKTATEELMTAWDRQICSDLVYAGYLGFQANLANFHNPVASQFTRLDYETFLREHIMQTMPYRTEAAAAAIRETYGEILNEYEEAIRRLLCISGNHRPEAGPLLGIPVCKPVPPLGGAWICLRWRTDQHVRNGTAPGSGFQRL